MLPVVVIIVAIGPPALTPPLSAQVSGVAEQTKKDKQKEAEARERERQREAEERARVQAEQRERERQALERQRQADLQRREAEERQQARTERERLAQADRAAQEQKQREQQRQREEGQRLIQGVVNGLQQQQQLINDTTDELIRQRSAAATSGYSDYRTNQPADTPEKVLPGAGAPGPTFASESNAAGSASESMSVDRLPIGHVSSTVSGPTRVFDRLSDLLQSPERTAGTAAAPISNNSGLAAVPAPGANSSWPLNSDPGAIAGSLFDHLEPATDLAKESAKALGEQLFDQLKSGDDVNVREAARASIKAQLSDIGETFNSAADSGMRFLIAGLPDDPRFDATVYYNTFVSPKTSMLLNPSNAVAYIEEMIGKPLNEFTAGLFGPVEKQ